MRRSAHVPRRSAHVPRVVGADRLGGRLALACALAAALTALTAAPASAAFRHPAVSASFGSDGTSGTSIGGLDQLAFSQASKRLYALGRSPARVHGFDTTTEGTYTALSSGFPITLAEPGGVPDLATDNSPSSSGAIYFLSESTGLYAFTSAGAGISGFPIGGFGDPCGAATDGEGNVWVGDYGSQSVKEFSSAGASLGSVNVAATGRPCHVAFDRSNDDLYVADYNGAVYRYANAGGYASGTLVDPSSTQALTVDASSNTLYVAHSSQVDAYNESGAHLESFATGLGSITGVAVDEARGIVYVSAGGKVRVLPGVVVPDAVTGDQTGDATVNGHVDPAGGGEIVTCEFEFGTDTSYGETAPCSQSTPINAPTDVSADLSGKVLGETTYHYRLVAANASGTNYGADRTFTPHFVSGLTTDPATGVGKNEATLNAHFIGTEEDTHYYFEWGTTTEYGNTSATPPGDDAGSTSGNTPLSYDVSGLLPETTYHYRVVASNGKGTSPGNDRIFTTVKSVADLATGAATTVTASSAMLHGSWTGEGEGTTCHFDWGYNTLYGNSTPDVDEGSGTGPQSAAVLLSGLSPVTTFHYRIVCSNVFGPAYGGDQMLKTLALPEVALLPPSDYTTSGVTLSGTVGPREGGSTTYHFEYGTTESYGASTPESPPVGSDNGTYPASAELTGLEPGTLYHYRLVATSPAGVREGKDQTFTTVPLLPTVDSTSASDVAPTTATLTAMINPGNGATLVIFDYGPGLSYGSRTLPTEATPADGADHPLSAQLTGLTPGTTYHYRAVAINFNGVATGADETFSTPDAPIVGGGSATGVTQTGALLSGNVQPGFSPTSYQFEYGPTSDYGHLTPAGGLGADNAVHPVSASLAGLAAGTTYHYRLVASNAIGTTSGSDHTFATAPAPPVMPGPATPRCRKRFVRRHGRCVRKHRRHRHHAKHRKRHHRHGGRNA